MATTLPGQFQEVILAQFGPDEDLLEGLTDIARKENIRTGVILGILGGLTEATLGYFAQIGNMDETRVEYRHVPGPLECTGHGTIGIEESGEPYVHVHLTVTNGSMTTSGHVKPGCLVRALQERSHFTVPIVRISGVELRSGWNEERRAAGLPGASYHELVATGE